MRPMRPRVIRLPRLPDRFAMLPMYQKRGPDAPVPAPPRGGSARAVVGPDVLAVVARGVALGPPLGGPLVTVERHGLATGVGGARVPGEQAGAGTGTAGRGWAAAARSVVGPHALAVVAGGVALRPPLGRPGVAQVRDLLAADVRGARVPRRCHAGTATGLARRAGR